MADPVTTLCDDSEFYWDTVVFKVEDKLFCVPRCEFVRSSEVFANMFRSPAGPEAVEGRDREHPIHLEGYKKREFFCLLRVMYPTAGSLLVGTKLELCMNKEEWISVLKLSVIWSMKKIRDYAIHKLSTDISLSPTEKITLARAHKVPAWLQEGLTNLVSGDVKPTIEDLAPLGWETAARILWIRDNSISVINGTTTLHFRRDDIRCPYCSSSTPLITGNHNCYQCRQAVPANEHLTFPGPGSNSSSVPTHRLVSFRAILSSRCGGTPFRSINFQCTSCLRGVNENANVRIVGSAPREMVEGMFGEEIKDYELAMGVAEFRSDA